MAEPGANPAKPDKKGNLFKKKVAGIPVPILLVVGGVAVYYLYTKYKASQPASTSSTATPTASSGTPAGTSGGYLDSGSGSGGYSSGGGSYDPNAAASTNGTTSPTDTSSLTTAPTAPVNQSNVTPIGKKTITVGGKAFNTVSGFTQNGVTYLGINNPAEAKKLAQQGVTLVHNPNDPNTSSLFVLIPKGKNAPTITNTPAKKAVAKKPKSKVKAK